VFSIRLHINSAIEITVRSWTGWHRHTALVLAAEAFLSVLRYQVELLGELSTLHFFSSGWVGSLVAFKQVRALVRLSLAETWVWGYCFLALGMHVILHWSGWRRHHQALARIHHYRKPSSNNYLQL